MGLTIHYGFTLHTKSVETVKSLLEKLRQKGLDLPYEHVDNKITHLTPEICAKGLEYYRGKRGVQHQPKWKQKIFGLLLDCGTYVNLPWHKKRSGSVHVDPSEAFVFQTCPGPGSEWASFGFARYPLEVEAIYKPEDDDRFTITRKEGGRTSWEFDYSKWCRHVERVRRRKPLEERSNGPFSFQYRDETKRNVRTGLGGCWRFSSFCKTQYASDPKCGGIGNFVRCHLSLIRMLEYAQELGIQVDIDDEGHFGPAHYSDDWREARAAGREPTYVDHPATHNIKELVQQVGDYNQLIAGMAGLMRDAAGARGMEMESPIFQFPNYEHLEADFHVKQGEEFDTVIKAFGEIAKKEVAAAKNATRHAG